MRDSSLPRFAARIGLAASDVAFPLAIALVLTLGFASPAYAYVDPSVMTYTIQALAGVAFGCARRRLAPHAQTSSAYSAHRRERGKTG